MNGSAQTNDENRPRLPLGLSWLTEIKRDPLYAASELQSRYGDVAALNILFRRIYYFFTPEAARQILVDRQTDFVREARLLRIFASFQGDNALTTEGTDWERQRRILAPGFTPKRVAGYTHLMHAAIRDSVADVLPASPGSSALVNADGLTTRITMDVILRTLFSTPMTKQDAAQLSVAIRALTRQSMREVYWPFVAPDWLPYPGRASKRTHRRTIQALIETYINARTASNAAPRAEQDVLDMLLSAKDEATDNHQNSLSAREVRDNCVLLFAAGFDTASSALCWWMGLMATHPGVADALRAELADAEFTASGIEQIARAPYLNATIKEAMRLYPPSTALFTRVAQRDAVIADTPVPKGTLVVIPIWQLHRDARSFPAPLEFRPERFMPNADPIPRSAYMPFGAGPHFCLGQHFALIEMALVAAYLIKHFDLALPLGTKLPDPTVDVALKPKTPLLVQVTRRETLS